MSSGPWLLALVDAVVVLAAAASAWFLLHRRDADGSSDREEWYDGAARLAREVRRTAASVEPPADPDRVSRRLLPLAARIDRHVRAAPTMVDDATYRGFSELGGACRRVALEHRPAEVLLGGVPLEDRLERLEEDAGALESRLVEAAESDPRP